MVNDDLSMFSADPVLTSLRDLSIENLHTGIASCVPQQLLDAPVPSYQVSNIRYSPGQKMIVGLTSDVGKKPISLRIFPRSKLGDRLAKAQLTHPDHSFLVDNLNAIAWVFPGERKLNLELVADREQLADLLRAHRSYELRSVELMHFVPEHTYTARVIGKRSDGSAVCEYIKIFADDQGEVTARIMRELARELHHARIRIPGDISYLAEHRLLLQSEVPRDTKRTLSYRAAADALAAFHGLSIESAPHSVENPESEHAAVLELVRNVLPQQLSAVSAASAAVLEALAAAPATQPVLLHGDAHLGNLFPVTGGCTGVIDFDQMAWGRAEDDLASFFAYTIWRRLCRQQDPELALRDLPSFVAIYNSFAKRAVAVQDVYVRLAHKLIAERVRRGIIRGKVSGVAQILDFARIAEQCLAVARQVQGGTP